MARDEDDQRKEYPATKGVMRMSMKDIHITQSWKWETKHISQDGSKERQDDKTGEGPSFKAYSVEYVHRLF